MALLRTLTDALRRAPELLARPVLLEGGERTSGERLSMLCAAAAEAKAYLSELAFRSPPSERPLPLTPIWDLNRFVGERGVDAGLLVVDLHRSQLPLLRPRADFYVPHWLLTVAPVPDDPSQLRSSSLASDLRRLAKSKLRRELSRDRGAFEDYHRRLYLPHLRASHGSSALPLSYQKHLAAFERGELVFVSGDAIEPLAGALLSFEDHGARIRSLGVAADLSKELRRVAGPAVYIFAMNRLAELGFKTVSLGRSRAFLDDGVLEFKNKWSHRVEEGSGRGFALQVLHPSSGARAFLAANPFVFERDGLHAAIFSEQPPLSDALDRRHIRGLRSVRSFSTDGSPRSLPAPKRITTNDPLAYASSILLDDLLRLVERERLLVYSEQNDQDPLLRELIEGARLRRAHPELLSLDPGADREAQGAAVARALRNGAFDAAIELSADSLYLTEAWEVARGIGCRVFSVAGLDAESFIRCVGGVDHARTRSFGASLRERVARARAIHVSCPHGTDLRMRLQRALVDRLARRSDRDQRTFFAHPSGALAHPRDATFLAGQIAFRGVRASFEGVAIVDGCLSPPREIGRLASPLRLRFERGALVGVDGPSRESDRLRAWLGGERAKLEHLCLGFNAGARISDSPLESERAFGALTVGFGEGRRHTDGIITRPTIELDGTALEVDGRFVLEGLPSEQERLLSAAGSGP